MQVEQRTFSLMVFLVYGGMGITYQPFYSRLIELLAGNHEIHKSVMMHWIRSKLCYELLKSFLSYLRGSRFQNRKINESEHSIAVKNEVCSIKCIQKLFNEIEIHIYTIK